MASAEHTADEAGGEAIFSSDGLPSLSAPPPPLPSVAPSADGDGVVEEASDPIRAFETFVVRKSEEKGWGVLDSNEGDRLIGAEDPRRRLFRLRAEIDELEAELSSRAGESSDFQSMSSQLRSRLESMGVDREASSLQIMLRGRQADLSQLIARDAEKFAPTNAWEATKLEGEKGKIVYELYRSEPANASSREAVLEDRLKYLEIAVGASGEGGSLFERVGEAVKLAKEVDAKEVDKVAAKAKVIRSDLEAAARAKAKLSSNNPNLSSQDAQTITSLHNQLIQLEGISSHLPLLTSRLQELSQLHSNAAEFGSRLDAAEETLGRTEALLGNLEEAVGRLEKGWKENMEGVERNVKRLDEIVAGK